MRSIRRCSSHLIVAILGLTTAGSWTLDAQTGQTSQSATFNIVLRGVRVGFETVAVTSSAGGYEISSSGRQVAPVELVVTRFDVLYTPDWQPQRLTIEGVLKGQLISLAASFGLTTVTVDVMQAGQKGSALQQVTPRTVVIPNNFYGSYEALAMRLGSTTVGTRFPIYMAPDGEASGTVDRISDRRFATPTGPIDLKQIDMTFTTPQGALAVELWIDARSHLARIAIPAQSLVVLRDDLSSVMTREEFNTNAGDKTLFIPANGFAIGATVTTPSSGATKSPAVILVGASGPQDREEAVAGIPIFAQLAGSLANAGFIVVRYDKRGTGQSGARTERLTIADYAEDVITAVKFLRDRKDVDDDRIAVVALGDGGAPALLAADRQDRIKAVALLGAGGMTGREVTLEQQRHALGQLKIPDAEKQAKIALQTQILDAATTGAGWEGVPADLRRQADTTLFKSWLQFDPAAVIPHLDQPLFILQGALDVECPPANADRLETLSRARTKLPATATTKIIVPGVNHRLVQATTGEPDEYESLKSRTVAPQVTDALIGWLRDVFQPRKK
jgi:pimeloyl-ACP methyl ester carboxylesterase